MNEDNPIIFVAANHDKFIGKDLIYEITDPNGDPKKVYLCKDIKSITYDFGSESKKVDASVKRN